MSFESALTTALDRLRTSKSDWYYTLYQLFSEPFMQEIDERLTDALITRNAKICPHPVDLFSNLALCPEYATKVVILSDFPVDSYLQASGRALDCIEFKNAEIPAETRSVLREFKRDHRLPQDTPVRSSFFYWGMQGVLLLNEYWTCEEGNKTAHIDLNWERFTNVIIKRLGKRQSPTAFILLGDSAHKYESLIGPQHLILKTSHPSPTTAGNGFIFSSIFSKTNDFLRAENRGAIDWKTILTNRYGVIK